MENFAEDSGGTAGLRPDLWSAFNSRDAEYSVPISNGTVDLRSSNNRL